MGFTGFNEFQQNPQYPEVQDISPHHVKAAQEHIVLIDVRENEEWNGELGHVEGSTLINLGALPENLSHIPQDKHVVLICRSGARSARAAAFLKSQGYTKVYNMLGGMILWNRQGHPVARE